MNEGLVLFCEECSTRMPTLKVKLIDGGTKIIYNDVCQPCLQVREYVDNLRYEL